MSKLGTALRCLTGYWTTILMYHSIADETRDESEVYLRDGSPVHVCRPVDTDRLDNLLVEYGLVPAEVVAEASAQVSEGQRLGDVLERMGVLDKAKLAEVLKAQVTRKLTRLWERTGPHLMATAIPVPGAAMSACRGSAPTRRPRTARGPRFRAGSSSCR